MRRFKTRTELMAVVKHLLAEGKQICSYREANKLDGFVGWILFM